LRHSVQCAILVEWAREWQLAIPVQKCGVLNIGQSTATLLVTIVTRHPPSAMLKTSLFDALYCTRKIRNFFQLQHSVFYAGFFFST